MTVPSCSLVVTALKPCTAPEDGCGTDQGKIRRAFKLNKSQIEDKFGFNIS